MHVIRALLAPINLLMTAFGVMVLFTAVGIYSGGMVGHSGKVIVFEDDTKDLAERETAEWIKTHTDVVVTRAFATPWRAKFRIFIFYDEKGNSKVSG